MEKTLRIVFAMSLLVMTGVRSYGWNDEGHMFIASVAYSNLTPETRTRVDALLRLNPKYESWVKMIPEGTSPAQSRQLLFMFASTWADALRREARDVPDVVGGPIDLSTGYADLRRHSDWHFIDLMFSTDGTAVREPQEPNLKTMIPALRAALQSNDTDSAKSYCLVWLIHLVGDAHQPLHCAQRATKSAPQGDYSGNMVIVCDPQCGRRLHALWDGLVENNTDSQPVKQQQQQQQQRQPQQRQPQQQRQQQQQGPPWSRVSSTLATNLNSDDWIKESFELAKNTVYGPPIGEGTGPFKLTLDYLATAKKVANQRAVLAGMRLARVLNTELK
jgi:hypothetical protein